MSASFRLPPLLQSAPVAIASVDLRGYVLDVNQALVEGSGYAADEVRGKPFHAFLDPGDQDAARASFGQLISGACESCRAERRCRTRSGDVRDVELSVSLVCDAVGAPDMCLAVLTDVTAHHQALADAARRAEELEAAKAEREQLLVETQRAHHIEAASRLKDEFLATVSHELRTPLNAILGWTRIMRRNRDFDPASTAHALDVIERNAAAQARLIDDLLDVSRIISGKIRLRMEPVEFSTIVADSLETLKPAADAKRVRLDAHVDPNLPALNGDPQRLQQILWNLLSNAVKFSEEGGHASLDVARDGRAVRITVNDNGVGIAPDVMPFVFDRFTQADPSSTRRHSGLGLGLAIVRHLVELHGGTVAAESPGEGRGATFRVSLPLPA